MTWRGCGRHAEQVLAPYPDEARCVGHGEAPRTGLLGWLTRR